MRSWSRWSCQFCWPWGCTHLSTQWLFEWIPIFRYGRFPVKFLFATNLCLALLAGTGWATLQSSEDASNSRRVRRRAIALLLALSAVLGALYGDSAWKLLGAARTAVGEFQWSGPSEPVRVGVDLIFAGIASPSAARRYVPGSPVTSELVRCSPQRVGCCTAAGCASGLVEQQPLDQSTR